MKIGGKNVSNTLYIGGQRPFTSADKSNLDKNTSARHEHANKNVLDGITAEKVSLWDAGGGSGGGGAGDVSGKEDKSNKVTVITANETAEKYPNVHAVINYLQSHGMTEAQAVECIKEYFKYNSAYIHEVIAGILLTTPAIHVPYVDDWSSVFRVTGGGKATSLQADLDTKSDKMRLLNSFTFAEAKLASDCFTQTDDGILYSDIPLKKVFIHTFAKTSGLTISGNTYTAFYFGVNGQTEKLLGNGIGGATISTTDTDGVHGYCEMDFDKKTVLQNNATKGGYSANIQFAAHLLYRSGSIGSVLGDNNIVNSIKWQSSKTDVLIPAGSKIEIWGCA